MLRIKRPNLLQNKTIVSSMVLVLGFAGTAGALQLLPSDTNQSQVTSSRSNEPVERASVKNKSESEKTEVRKKASANDSTDWTKQSQSSQQVRGGQATTSTSSSTSTTQSSSQPSGNQTNQPPSGSGSNWSSGSDEPTGQPTTGSEPCDESVVGCVIDDVIDIL